MAHLIKPHVTRGEGEAGPEIITQNCREHEEEKVNALTCKALDQREGLKKKKEERNRCPARVIP